MESDSNKPADFVEVGDSQADPLESQGNEMTRKLKDADRAAVDMLFDRITSTGAGNGNGDRLVQGIPTPQKRYQGGNRGGWSNADFDRLAEMFNTELDRTKRTQILIDMTKIQAEDLPAISIFFVTQPWAFVSALKGPKLVAPDSNMSWNIETWEFR